MVFAQKGEDIWQRIGREPSGNPFNSLIQLELENGIPRNPLINAGAIVVCDIMLTLYKDPQSELLAFLHKLSNDNTIDIDPEVLESERETGHRNYALAHFIKSQGNLNNDVQKVLDLYFFQICHPDECMPVGRGLCIFGQPWEAIVCERAGTDTKPKQKA